MISKEENDRRRVFARKEATKVLSSVMPMQALAVEPLIEAVTEVLLPHMYEPHLGCASTLDIINELIARLSEDRLTLTEEKIKAGDFSITSDRNRSFVEDLVTMSKDLTEEELRYKTVPDDVR